MSKVFNSKIYEQYIDKENLSSSLSKIEALLDKKNNNELELLDVKAEVLNLMGRVDEATVIYKKILEADDEYINAYIALSNLYLAKEFKDEKNYSSIIVALLKKAEKINPADISYYVLAGTLKDNGNLDESIEYYTKALRQEKNDTFFLKNIYVELGRIFTEQKKYSLALNAYDNAIKYSVEEDGDDSHCSGIYVAKREIYSGLNDENKTKEMDDRFASAEKRYKERPTHIYHGKLGEKFQNIADRLQKLGKHEKETRKSLFEMVSLTAKETYPDKAPNYKELQEIIDFVLNEVDQDGTVFNKEVRALEKAYLIKLFNESHA